jgi:hypothetical protein
MLADARRFAARERDLMSDEKDEKKIEDEELDKVSGGTGPHEGHPIGGRGIDPQERDPEPVPHPHLL